MVTIVADKTIQGIDVFDPVCNLICLDHKDIIPQNLTMTDCLICRTNLTINADLLSNTPIKCVATVSSGYDHFDVDYLNQRNISWTCAPGCNADAVTDYVLACIENLSPSSTIKAAGIIGVGHVGEKIIPKFRSLGFSLLMNDPPRTTFDPTFKHTPLSQFENLDLICLHPALTCEGEHPSYHLITDKFLSRQKEGCIIINASRGEIIDPTALKKHAKRLTFCLDVFPNEPNIDPELVKLATIATPHIAGLSRESRVIAINMIYRTLAEMFGWDNKVVIASVAKQSSSELCSKYFTGPLRYARGDDNVDPVKITKDFKKSLETNPKNIATEFQRSRENYANW